MRGAADLSGTLCVMTDPLVIAGKPFRSRLMVGTGKYPDAETLRRAIEA